MDDEGFMKYFSALSGTRGWNPNPDDPNHFYDMRMFYDLAPQAMIAESLSDTTKHFPDTFKRPGHPWMSPESRYYEPGMKAGKWEGDTYRPLPTNEEIIAELLKPKPFGSLLNEVMP